MAEEFIVKCSECGGTDIYASLKFKAHIRIDINNYRISNFDWEADDEDLALFCNICEKYFDSSEFVTLLINKMHLVIKGA